MHFFPKTGNLCLSLLLWNSLMLSWHHTHLSQIKDFLKFVPLVSRPLTQPTHKTQRRRDSFCRTPTTAKRLEDELPLLIASMSSPTTGNTNASGSFCLRLRTRFLCNQVYRLQYRQQVSNIHTCQFSLNKQNQGRLHSVSLMSERNCYGNMVVINVNLNVRVVFANQLKLHKSPFNLVNSLS